MVDRRKRKLRAIDLYSGVGGWSLGLRLAGIEVVASYEQWGPANETNFKNNSHQAQTVDIRRLSLVDLPKRIDIVVGSPPCTEFSYSNSGGNGAISDGLAHVAQFLKIVEFLRPRFWLMENVPRIKGIIEREAKRGGRLQQFSKLCLGSRIVDMAEYGLPQRRKRCLVGNIDFGLLETYRGRATKTTLGDVVRSLGLNPPVDPLFGITIPSAGLRDHLTEEPLSNEETRINRAAKTSHPVYNAMPFPDPLDRTARTITAVCTRVSRESIVINRSNGNAEYRRLTNRERASLQGFPITYQFYGTHHGQRRRMIGNAIPPFFTYLVGQCIRATPVDRIRPQSSLGAYLSPAYPLSSEVIPERAGRVYRATRRFRFAIPHLRLKSGVRFELVNNFKGADVSWQVNFYFGTSREIHSKSLGIELRRQIVNLLPLNVRTKIKADLATLEQIIARSDIERMQQVWSHKGIGGTSPFAFLDMLDQFGKKIRDVLESETQCAHAILLAAMSEYYLPKASTPTWMKKLVINAPLIVAGLLVGSVANMSMAKRFGSLVSRTRSRSIGNAPHR